MFTQQRCYCNHGNVLKNPLQPGSSSKTDLSAPKRSGQCTSSTNIRVCRDSCLTPSINLPVTTANKRRARSPWCNPDHHSSCTPQYRHSAAACSTSVVAAAGRVWMETSALKQMEEEMRRQINFLLKPLTALRCIYFIRKNSDNFWPRRSYTGIIQHQLASVVL